MSWFRRRGDDPGALEGPFGLGDGEAPGGWDPEDGGEEPDPLAAPIPEPEPAPPPPPRQPVAPSSPVVRGVAAVAALLVIGLIGDHLVGTGSPARAASAGPLVPRVAAPDSLSSTWFCPALQATANSDAKGRIIIANPTAGLLTGTVTLMPSSGAAIVEKPTVQPYSRLTYRLEDLAPGPFAAATVSLDQPGGAVEHEVQGTLGQSMTPCATSSASHWYFASGQTTDGNTELLSLYNPYPAPAIADLSFATETGPAIPDGFQGIVVPAGGFNVIDVGARVRLRASVASTVDVRSGRLVVDKVEIQSASARVGPHGLSLVLGAAAPGTTWYYPDGASGPGIKERFDIYNPGDKEAEVALTPTLDQGSADAFPITVPPTDRVSLEVDGQQRIPPGVGQAWALTSTNGVPVVAERIVVSAPPSPHTGVGDTPGSPTTAAQWVFAGGSAGAGADEWLALFDPGPAPARVQLTASGLGRAQPLPVVTVAAGSRQLVHIGAEYPKGIVVLEVAADAPIVAERGQFLTTGPGMSDSIGIVGASGEGRNG